MITSAQEYYNNLWRLGSLNAPSLAILLPGTENIYNIAVIVDYFVSNQPEIEECYNLAPIIKNLRQNADLLNAFFIDNEK